MTDKALEAARVAYEHHQDTAMDQQHSSVSAYIDALEASLQAMQARAEKAERERDDRAAHHEYFAVEADNQRYRAETAEARVKELEEERDAMLARIEDQRANFAGLQAVQDALNLIIPPAKGGSNG